MNKLIAERRLFIEPIGANERRLLIIRIGHPYWDESRNVACCPRQYLGLFDSIDDAIGIDAIQAINLATDIDSMLKPHLEKYKFYWEDGEPYF